MSKFEIYGKCEPRFKAVKDVFTRNFEEGMEVGASFAVTINGEYIIDIWGGFKDKDRTQPWEEDTICAVYSTTKVPTVICTMMCVDRGLLDLDERVAVYWPEFGQNGKEDILVRHLFSHTSGLAGIEEKIPLSALYDWDKIISLLAAQKPWWKPGTKSGYHALTHGYLLGELVRRVTGKSLCTFFKEEVATPLKLDFHIGLPEEHVPRVSKLIPDLPNMEVVTAILVGMFKAANKIKSIKNEIKDWENKIVLDFGNGHKLTLNIKKGKIIPSVGAIDKPDCKFTTTIDKSGVIYSLFSSFNQEPDYVSANLKMEGKPEDLAKVKKLFEMIATETRKIGPVVIKMHFNPINLRDMSGDREWQAAEIPAANGHGNARSVAKIASIIACGGEVDGIRFISEENVEKILEEQIYGKDLVISSFPIRWGLGVGLSTKERPRLSPKTCFWGGAGGSAIIMDLDAKIGIGYVMNKMRNQPLKEILATRFHQDTRGDRLITTLFESLEML